MNKIVSVLRQVGGFLQVFTVYSTNKTDRHDITEILLKVVLNTITPTPNTHIRPGNLQLLWTVYSRVICKVVNHHDTKVSDSKSNAFHCHNVL